MNRPFDKLSYWIVDRRWAPMLVIIALTAVACVGHSNPRSLLDLIDQVDPVEPGLSFNEQYPDAPPNVDPVSISNSDAIIVARSKQFFTPEGAAAMRRVVDDLEELDQVRNILWMDRVPILNIFGLPEPLFPRSKASQQRFDAAKQKALAHPLVRGQLLSEDTETMLLMVSYNYYHLLADYDATDLLRETAEKAVAESPGVEITFQVTGRIPSAIAAIAEHESNQLTWQLVGYGMIGLMTIILFRGIRAVIIVALAPGLGVFWAVGIIQFFEYDQNPLIDVILPVLVSLIGLTDGVHLMVQIRKLRAEGVHERDAARQGVQQVGLACFLTSLTTAIGFGSLVLAESEWVQQFGKCSVVGVILCFFSVVTVIPLACSTWLGRKVHIGHDNSLIDRNLVKVGGLIDFVLSKPKLFSALGIATTVLLFSISMTLKPDQRQTDELPPSAEATQALKHMDVAFDGLEFSSVEINWSPNIPGDSPQVLEVITEVDDVLRAEELIGHPLSIRNLIDAQPGSGPPAERMSLLELLPPPLKRAFYTPEYRTASVTFRVRDLGIAQYGPVFERINRRLAEISRRHPGFYMRLDGSAVWRWENLYQIVVDLATSLGTASVIIFFVLSLVYRSIRLGLISIIPNMFPLVVTGAYLALAGYKLEIVMVLNFTICLGIAVDDTIHFLTRYREERAGTPNEDLAIRRAFTGVGTALIMTTTVLVAGFATVMLSESRDHQIFATMGAITISAALFGDLVFLPALLSRFANARNENPPSDASEEHTEVQLTYEQY